VGGPYEPYLQSARLDIYKKYAQQLLAAGFAYPDPYSEHDLEAFRKQAEAEKRPFLFREHRPDTIQEWNGVSPLRFKTPIIKRYEWEDAVLGKLSAGEEALDDFILIKGDGYPTYNFAHVVDDIEMQITHVMRGQEFVASTPKFLSLYDALDHRPPVFATLPPILGESGTKKLSKRDGAKDILEYRADGILPEAMLNFLALLGWHPGGDREVLTPSELIAEFSLERVQRSGAQFDEAKLRHLNREHLKRLSDDAFIKGADLSAHDDARLRRALHVIRERAYTLREAHDMLVGNEAELAWLANAPALDTSLLLAKRGEAGAVGTKTHLTSLIGLIEQLPPDASAEDIKAALMPYADTITKEDGGRGAALWPLRYALSGQERSPDPFTLIHILDTDESRARIKTALELL
jgi:glutamyl-tRNA synthetase